MLTSINSQLKNTKNSSWINAPIETPGYLHNFCMWRSKSDQWNGTKNSQSEIQTAEHIPHWPTMSSILLWKAVCEVEADVNIKWAWLVSNNPDHFWNAFVFLLEKSSFHFNGLLLQNRYQRGRGSRLEFWTLKYVACRTCHTPDPVLLKVIYLQYGPALYVQEVVTHLI